MPNPLKQNTTSYAFPRSIQDLEGGVLLNIGTAVIGSRIEGCEHLFAAYGAFRRTYDSAAEKCGRVEVVWSKMWPSPYTVDFSTLYADFNTSVHATLGGPLCVTEAMAPNVVMFPSEPFRVCPPCHHIPRQSRL